MRPSGQAPSVGATFAALSQVLVGMAAGVSAALVHFPVGGGQAVRYALAAAAMYAVLRMRRTPRIRIGLRDWGLLFLLALLGQALFNQLLIGALEHADPATVGSILGCAPVVLAVAAPLMARRRPGARIVAGSLLVVGGAVAVEGFGSSSATGLVLALGVLGCELAFSLLAVPLLPRLGPLRVATYSTMLAVPQSLAIGAVTDGTGLLRMPTPAEAAALVFIGLVATVAAFLLWYSALGTLGAERAGLFCGLIPVSAALSALLLGTGEVRALQLAGSLLVGLGVAVGMSRRRTPEPPPRTAPATAEPTRKVEALAG
ncbi:DMT family transporter [Yinghuangia soli]|uniref:DMT family transporter n=1 Tax=Yinghuangia soli TaxID=2908204 RepID=A0AA41TYU7_9ACTN|nr:DMT family transporter [Yinghuangia soli]MCF2528163.1 DMT family transporter [Yinghuangia soli]